jgi:hypothetical protein
MNIPYPCPKPLEEMKSTKNGFYCNDCGHTLIDIRAENSTLPPKGSCVVSYEEVEDEKSAEINKSYRFALALFIVMGSSMILNNSSYSQEFITSINEIRESSLKVDSSFVYVKGSITDKKGRPIKPVEIQLNMTNGNNIILVSNMGKFSFKIPIHQKNKVLKFTFNYFDETKTIDFLFDGVNTKIDTITFKRNIKDRYKKRDYLYKPKTGRFL